MRTGDGTRSASNTRTLLLLLAIVAVFFFGIIVRRFLWS